MWIWESTQLQPIVTWAVARHGSAYLVSPRASGVRLVRARLLASHQGIRGGYGLSRPADLISVADVIQAIDGPLTVTACSDSDHSCDQYAKCNIRDPLWRIKDRIVSALAATSVSELATDMPVLASPSAAVPVSVMRK